MGERVHVGLPTAASIAVQGVEVIGVDVDAERLSAIGTGAPPTAEGDLRELVRKVVAAGRLADRGDPSSRPTPSSSRCRRRTSRLTSRT